MPSDSSSVSLADDSPPKLPTRNIASALGFLAMVLTILGSLHLYLARRLIAGSGLSPVVQAWAILALVGLFFSMPAAALLGRFAPKWIAAPARWVGFVWMGAFGVLLTLTAGTDLLGVLLGWLGVSLPAHWQALTVLGIALPAVVYGIRVARGPARVEKVTVSLAGLGTGLQGLRIAQISDIHIGDTLDGSFLERLVRDVNALAPDVIAVTGDLVDGSVAALRDQTRHLADLRAPLGVYFITGNHEYYSGADAWEAEVRRLGLTVLHNEHRVLERGGSRLVLGGVTDFNGGQFDPRHDSRPDLAFAGSPEGLPRVLLAHQPRSAKAAAQAGVHLQLSGHTHGGQIFPFNFFVRLQQPTVQGLKTLAGVQVYTHRGSGYWGPPIRLGAPPEIAEITLTAQPVSAAR